MGVDQAEGEALVDPSRVRRDSSYLLGYQNGWVGGGRQFFAFIGLIGDELGGCWDDGGGGCGTASIMNCECSAH